MSGGQGRLLPALAKPSFPNEAALVRLVRVVEAVRTKTAWRNAFRLPVPSLLMRSPACRAGAPYRAPRSPAAPAKEEAR